MRVFRLAFVRSNSLKLTLLLTYLDMTAGVQAEAGRVEERRKSYLGSQPGTSEKHSEDPRKIAICPTIDSSKDCWRLVSWGLLGVPVV